jgi:hypothetical protein
MMRADLRNGDDLTPKNGDGGDLTTGVAWFG